MAILGKRNLLSVIRESSPGLYLDGGELGEILLPGRYIPKNLTQGQKLGRLCLSAIRKTGSSPPPKRRMPWWASSRI